MCYAMENLKYKGGFPWRRFIKNFCAGILTYRPQRDAAGGQRSLFLHAEGRFYLRLAGVDGIHFCFVRGFGEAVFAVSR